MTKQDVDDKPGSRIERTLQNAITGRGTQSQVDRITWAIENLEIYKVLEKQLADLRQRYLLKHGYFGAPDPEINEALLVLLDKALEVGHWKDSILFENAGKQLRDLKQRVEQELALAEHQASTALKPNKFGQAREGFLIVFISLYQMGGESIHVWEKSLKNISSYGVGRPIYRFEEDVKNLLSSKPGSRLDAYVSVYVQEIDIVTPKRESQIVRDHFGRELLLLKDKAISKDNIIKFVNYSGTYHFEGEELKRDEGFGA